MYYRDLRCSFVYILAVLSLGCGSACEINWHTTLDQIRLVGSNRVVENGYFQKF